MWASEMTLGDLQWWMAHKLERSQQGGQYAEKDAKLADKLRFWVEWRLVSPTEPWTGIRNDGQVTARAPAGKATVYQWEQRGPVTTALPADGPSWLDGDEEPEF